MDICDCFAKTSYILKEANGVDMCDCFAKTSYILKEANGVDICDRFAKTSYILKEANGVESRPTHTPESTRNIISPESEPQKIGLPKKINKVNIRRGEKGTE